MNTRIPQRALISARSHIALLCVLGGCVGHATRLSIDQGRRASSDDVARLVTSIAERIAPLGMVEHPGLEAVRETSEESPEYEFVVVHEWVRRRGTAGDDVRVFVARSKRDGVIFVNVQNRTWPRRTPFTDSLGAEIGSAIDEALPDHSVTVEHGAHGLFFD